MFELEPPMTELLGPPHLQDSTGARHSSQLETQLSAVHQALAATENERDSALQLNRQSEYCKHM